VGPHGRVLRGRLGLGFRQCLAGRLTALCGGTAVFGQDVLRQIKRRYLGTVGVCPLDFVPALFDSVSDTRGVMRPRFGCSFPACARVGPFRGLSD